MSRLIVRGRDDADRPFPIEKEVVSIGRTEENDIPVREPGSSRHHCKILKTGGGFKLVDLGSRNGTLVNGARVQWKLLEEGDEIAIGATRIYFERAPAVVPVATTGETQATAPVDAPTPAPEAPAEPPAPPDVRPPDFAAEEVEKYRTLLDINKAINSELGEKRLFDRILDAAIRVTGAERGFLILREKGGKVAVKTARNLDREAVRRAEEKISKSVLREVLANGASLRVDDAGRDGRFRAAESVVDMNLAAILAAPLRARDGVIGAIYLDHRFRADGFTAGHLALLEVVADQAAVAVENARLFEENLAKQEELARANRELEELSAGLREKVASQVEELNDMRRIVEERGRAALTHGYPDIVTRSPKMLEVLGVVDRVTSSSVPVLIQGESGTGKELVARALHFNGPRKARSFVAQNCAAVPGPLMESEFFGHVRGAFTGADRDKPGLFELADQGTIFLDEIGEMDFDLQSKLLRVLQNGELRRVGAKEPRKVDVRLVSASNRDLQALCREGKFRTDLYYRIAVVHIDLPPLRERREDVPLLAQHFLERSLRRRAAPGRPEPARREFAPEALQILARYHWPGNVRELENEVERALALSSGRIEAEHLSPHVRDPKPARGPAAAPAAPGGADTLDLRELVNRATEDVERRAIGEALRRTSWKKIEAAALLGVSRPTLDAKIEKYGLKREDLP
jgi:transcriptional regulator with GAF, ATPase, and Fis domain